MCFGSLGMTDYGSCEHIIHSNSLGKLAATGHKIHVTKLFMSAGLWMVWESSMIPEIDCVL